MERVVAFIDGFNIYHSIADKKLNNLKWLNYRTLAQAFIKRSSQQLKEVYYFTALANWNSNKVNRHKIYIEALKTQDVKVILGKFKRVTKKCRKCYNLYKTFEEKETDVNIAIYLLSFAFQDKFDLALLFSGDSDLVPAIKKIKEWCPDKKIKVIIPYGRSAEYLKKVCDEYAHIKRKHLEKCQLPENISNNIKRPSEWN